MDGKMDILFSGEVDNAVAALEESIASVLGIHPQDVTATYDDETGEVAFSVSGATPEELEALREIIANANFQDELNAALPSTVSVQSMEAPTEITATVTSIIAVPDGTDAEQATADSESYFADEGYKPETTGNYHFYAFFQAICSVFEFLLLRLRQHFYQVLLQVHLQLVTRLRFRQV